MGLIESWITHLKPFRISSIAASRIDGIPQSKENTNGHTKRRFSSSYIHIETTSIIIA